MIDNSTCIDFYLDWKSEFINLHMELFNVRTMALLFSQATYDFTRKVTF